MKRIISIILCLVLLLGCAACAGQSLPAEDLPAEATPIPETPAAAVSQSARTEAVRLTVSDPDDMFTDRDFDSSWSDCVSIRLADGASAADGGGVDIQGNEITITAEGSYLLSGSLTDGRIVVNVTDEEKVQLILAGAHVSCRDSAALYIPAADKVFLTLAEGTDNSLLSLGEYPEDGSGIDAAVFSRVDLSINGSGRLEVSGETGHGIVSKDDIKICSGTLLVSAPMGKAIDGKDSIRIAGGDITVTAGADGLQSEHEDLSKGFIYMSGGSLSVTAAGDGLQSSGGILIRDGSLSIVTNGGHVNAEAKAESFGMGRGSKWGTVIGAAATTGTAATTASTAIDSFKGIKSDAAIEISGGSFLLDCADDAIHSNADILISGGSFSLQTGDDGVHADTSLTITGGSFDIPVCFEGLEGTDILIAGGSISIVSSDDGLNAAGGNDGSGLSDFGGAGPGFGSGSGSLTIQGGTLYLNTGGDSLDTNGSMNITGGSICISGPSDSFNGILDSDGSMLITGGTVAASGVSGMQQNFSTGSTQGSLLVSLSGTQAAGSSVCLYNAAGELLVQHTPDKDYDLVILSAPGIAVGETYTLIAGTETQTITPDTLLYGGGMGGMGGFGGGKGGRWG